MLLSMRCKRPVAFRTNLSLPPRPHLQDNHYRPEDSDACLLCDCYPVGSFSRTCDRESGQCQCKPGVIGRQCDRCDNPFAEVTPNGCEGQNSLPATNSALNPFFIIDTDALKYRSNFILVISSLFCPVSISDI